MPPMPTPAMFSLSPADRRPLAAHAGRGAIVSAATPPIVPTNFRRVTDGSFMAISSMTNDCCAINEYVTPPKTAESSKRRGLLGTHAQKLGQRPGKTAKLGTGHRPRVPAGRMSTHIHYIGPAFWTLRSIVPIVVPVTTIT